MNTLFIVNSSKNIDSCLEAVGSNDGLLLIEDAVYTATRDLKALTNQCYVLKEDLTARGIKVTEDMWQEISYSQFVKKILVFEKSISWL